jgi:hypothetical protein
VIGLGADEVVCYDSEEVQQQGAGGVIRALQKIVERRGKVDIVFDSVSSHDPRDQLASYEHQIHATRSREGEAGAILKNDGKYLMLGGLWHDWVKAHLLR